MTGFIGRLASGRGQVSEMFPCGKGPAEKRLPKRPILLTCFTVLHVHGGLMYGGLFLGGQGQIHQEEDLQYQGGGPPKNTVECSKSSSLPPAR